MIEIQRWLYGGATETLKGLAVGAESTLPVGLAFAMLFGFAHAFMPGHGKVAIVSYYLAQPARILGGLLTSTILILTHVGSAVVLVLAGFAVLRVTLGGAGRAPAFEAASAVLVTAIGLWMMFHALRQTHAHAGLDGRALAFATGLIPCPLTTFIMVYAAANGIVWAGLLVSAAMAAGMIVTILIFAAGAILLRERLLGFLARSEPARARLGHALETIGAAAVIAFGLWLFATRTA